MIINASISVSAELEEVEDCFWNIQQWMGIWLPMRKILVLYDDNVNQEIEMTVNRDGVDEKNRTIRFRDKNLNRIDFFSPSPPSMMQFHTGAWVFEMINAECQISAVRNFDLLKFENENELNFTQRKDIFKSNFRTRLENILYSFKNSIEAGGRLNV